jgi:hypothetical protein
MYWKNGVLHAVGGASLQGQANSIFKMGNDLYLAGQSNHGGNTGFHATYWKNGVPVVLDSTASSSSIRSIFVSGADVYAAGDLVAGNMQYPVYWKNGVVYYLSDKSFTGQASAIIVK